MLNFEWNAEKNEKLILERDVSFKQMILQMKNGHILDIINHPDSKKYPNQQIFIVEFNDYAYMIPFVKNESGFFLKTIIPSRKATKQYLKGNN